MRTNRRHAIGGRWFVDETYVRVAGIWRYVYRAVDHHGHAIDILLPTRLDGAGARQSLPPIDSRPRAEVGSTPRALSPDAADSGPSPGPYFGGHSRTASDGLGTFVLVGGYFRTASDALGRPWRLS